MRYAKRDGLRIVEIDVSKLGSAKLIDLTNAIVRSRLLRHPVPKALSKSSAEVLIEGIVPAGALKVIFTP